MGDGEMEGEGVEEKMVGNGQMRERRQSEERRKKVEGVEEGLGRVGWRRISKPSVLHYAWV